MYKEDEANAMRQRSQNHDDEGAIDALRAPSCR